MSKQVLISMLRQGNTGSEILSILDTLASDNVSNYDYIESPMIESALGLPTLTEIDFWCILGGSQMPLLSIPNSAQIPVVAGVFGVGGGPKYKTMGPCKL